MAFTIAKTDDSKGLVFGYANQITDGAGQPIVDRQGDIIDLGDLEDAAVEFMQEYRKSGLMHTGLAVGSIVESAVLYPEKLEAMGVPGDVAKAMPSGWWIGVKVPPAVMAKVKDGTYRMFSIQGEAVKEAV